MTKNITMAALAARVWFTKRERANREQFWTLQEDAPDWLRTLVYAAHGNAMPDDWRYAFIVQSLDSIAEADGPDDVTPPEPSIYTHELTGWLHSRADRHGYCEGADGLGNFILTIAAGQAAEISEVFESVRESLESHLVDLEAV